MPAIDIYGEVSPESELILDITSLKFSPLVMDLLPHGHAWDREDPILGELVKAESLELSRVDVRARALERELDPSQTFELLTDWETSYGLPECSEPDTLEGRRTALAAKLLAQSGHDHSYGWWDALVSKLGYTLHFVDLGPSIMTCEDDCIDVVTDEAFMFALAVDHGLDDGLLECFVGHNALLISFPVVHYLWTSVNIGVGANFRGVCCSAKGYSLLVADGGQLYMSSDDLTFWTPGPTQLAGLTACCAVDDVLLAVGYVGVNGVRSSDNGATWSSFDLIDCDMAAVARGPLDDLVAVAVGEDGRIWRTQDAGLNWGEQVSPTANYLYGVTSCVGWMVAVGNAGVVIRSQDNGVSWAVTAILGGGTVALQGVSGMGELAVAVGDDGSIWRSPDAGATWAQMVSPTADPLYAVVGSSSGRWTACGGGGVIIQSLDQGITWEIQVSPTTNDLHCAGFHRPDGQVLLAGDNGEFILE